MSDRAPSHPIRSASLAIVCLLALRACPAQAQDIPAPILPSPIPSATVSPDPDLMERLTRLEEHLNRVTKHNEIMQGQLDRLAEQNQRLQAENRQLSGSREAVPVVEPVAAATSPTGGAASSGGATSGGGSASGGGDPTATGRAQEAGNRHLGKLPVNSTYDFGNDGFNWSAHDDEITFGIRAMSQVEARVYQQPGQFPVSDGFYNPRTRIYFEGHFSKPIQYEFSFQNTFDNVALLDAYVNFNYDPRFQLRVGRYKTPFAYEWYRIHVWHLLSPERSLFANNYEGNRRFGLMGWGSLFDQRVEYAVGSFNTQRNSYQPFESRQDVMSFVNFKPFFNREEGFLLRDLQFGGSVDAGLQDQSLVPQVLRTNSSPSAAGVDSSGASNSATLPFLAFNPAVRERGSRALWELHAAYYHNGLSLLGAWQGGHESYALGTEGASRRIPIGGWFAQAGYILTGETIRDRTLIDPIRPFDLRRDHFGLGAFEVTARYSRLSLDREVFTAGLADPSKWTNRAEMTDVGFNWYLNKFTKVYFDWEHAMFGNPVVYNSRTGAKQLTSDLFWLRFQVYF